MPVGAGNFIDSRLTIKQFLPWIAVYFTYSMIPRPWSAFLFFLSAYSPLLFVLIMRDYDFTVLRFNHPFIAFAVMLPGLVGALLSIIVVRKIRGGNRVAIVSVRNRGDDLINYALPYLASFFEINIADPHDILAVAVFMAVLFILSVRTRSLFLNPILALDGYNLLEIEFMENGISKTRDVLTKFDIRSGTVCRVEPISIGLLLITEKYDDQERNQPTEHSEKTQKPRPEEMHRIILVAAPSSST